MPKENGASPAFCSQVESLGVTKMRRKNLERFRVSVKNGNALGVKRQEFEARVS
jgi:hypothetical protein